MSLYKIDPKEFTSKPVDLWLNKWFLLTSGNMEEYNCMTVAWGSIGAMWNKPIVQIVVRPGRYTYEFLERSDSFTLCSFPGEYKKDLSVLGTKSGRDGDKLSETKLTLIKSDIVESPSFKEADLILECKKNYWQDMNPQNFLNKSIFDKYPLKDYHRIYFGEIVVVKSV